MVLLELYGKMVVLMKGSFSMESSMDGVEVLSMMEKRILAGTKTITCTVSATDLTQMDQT